LDDRGAVPEGADMEGVEAEEDANKLYCYCQQPYNATLFYIQVCPTVFHCKGKECHKDLPFIFDNSAMRVMNGFMAFVRILLIKMRMTSPCGFVRPVWKRRGRKQYGG
jgi:hypothetical protein